MNIIRVFAKKTSCTPDDPLVFIGAPPEVIPEHDKIHISCIFTWDKGYCRILKDLWQARTDKPVLLGGPAFDSPTPDFIPGVYVKKGIAFTTRGCNNNCSFCGRQHNSRQ